VALSLENKRSKALEIYSHFLGHTFDLEELNSKIEKLVQINGANLPYYEQQFQQLLPLSKGEHTVGLHLLRCFLFIALGQGEKVQEDIVALEAAKVSYPALPFMLGVAYERLGKQERALEHYRAIHEDEKHYLWANQRMVQLLQQSGKMDAALALALNLINYKFADWEAYLLAATVYGAMERYAEGIELLEQGVRRYPHKVRILFMQGALQEKSGQISPCIATIERVVKLDPFNHTAYNFLGYLYAERGENLDQAEKLITTALDLKPGDGFYLDSLGMVNFQKGKYAEALSLYLRALAQVPEEGVILEHVGDVYSKQNEQEQAVNYWKKALEKKIEEKNRLRIQKKLGS
jgi:tetratricopeptide (TPR) repeat protein